MKEYKVILSAKVARILLQKGFTISDIKGNKENKDKTVFVFNNSDALEKALKEYTNFKTHSQEGEKKDNGQEKEH